ncbi:hypothetical protein MTZ49_07210 [Entomomonas sp. E2T0]|uniref:hypothetical protein n=1 Tax=Entomomonas sp. E2T0 TaxID=2930213 RepID=UPI0022284110|nr:hypothetical protein [Entomomonas sp. E2T0]UYZ85327.1 hypothetical protein MTZ49_07210 [Entomomonas sp. E2T0]
MLVCELIKIYREEEKDKIPSYFTSDFMLITYLNDALNEFAKKTMSFYDTSSPLTQVYVPKEQHLLPFDQRILEIKQAIVRETGDNLRIISANVADPTPYSLLLNSEAGEMILTKKYHYPVNIYLRVIRKPLKRLTLEDINQIIPDINEEDYRVLLHYIKYLAFSVADADIFDPNRAATNLALFEQKCQQIKDQNLRRRSAIQPIAMEWIWNV